MTDPKKKDGTKEPAGIAPLPWEIQADDAVPNAEETLFDLLGSDPDFQEEEEAEDADELESDESEEDEDDETEDDEDDDDPEGENSAEGDDDDEDPEEDEDDEDGSDDDEDQEEDDDLHEVKVQGETSKVTLEELKAGYSRTEDYTRKRQADSAEQATAMEQIGKVRDEYGSHLEQLQAVMESMTPAEPDWDAIRKESPGEYAAQKQDHADRLQAIEKVASERVRVAEEKRKESDANKAVYLQAEMGKLVEAIDTWKNDAVRATEIAELRDFAVEAYGFTGEDLDNVVDHRLLLLLRENFQSRAKVTKGKKEIRKKSKGAKKLKPGGGRNRRVKGRTAARKANKAARERLAHSGSVQDAADTILGLLGDDD